MTAHLQGFQSSTAPVVAGLPSQEALSVSASGAALAAVRAIREGGASAQILAAVSGLIWEDYNRLHARAVAGRADILDLDALDPLWPQGFPSLPFFDLENGE